MRAAVFFILALGLSAGSCSSPTDPGLEGGILAAFDVNGERYSIFITNPQTIDQVIALSHGQSDAAIPNGLNDGRPSYVEANLDSWAGRNFGPWSARLVSVKDYR